MTTPSHAEPPRERRPDSSGGRSRIWGLIVGFAITLVVIDIAAGRLAAPRNLREVEDGVADFRRSSPTTLVIGSSHARTFHVLADSLLERSGGRERLLSVPVEWGKLSSYRWVLEQRLLPLIDSERGADLRQAIIVTEWWDSCHDPNPAKNLPARAWTWRHYWADLRANGFTSYNQNFLGYRWSRLWRRSALVQDRGHARILTAARAKLAPRDSAAALEVYNRLVEVWRQIVIDGNGCIGSESEMAALRSMIATLQQRGVQVTLLLYPRMPVTLTPTARATTLPRFAAMVDSLAGPRGVRVVDLTDAEPLTDADFGGDFDHVLPAGNARFSGWALDGPLAFLLGPAR